MKTEIFLENYQIDISADISSLLTFSIDDINDFSARGTTWSKTIVLPGTAKNNKLFGHIFQIGQSNLFNSSLPNINYNFNASKSAKCIIFQDNIQTFKGVLRLLEIVGTQGRYEYEVAVFGELTSLNVALSSFKLEDLDFSEYDHTFSKDNIVDSWDNPGGSGYYYPLIDYGTYSTDKKNWDVRTFRPALYTKEYIDKMFEASGFRYSSALFDTDRFKNIIIPHNQKRLTKKGTSLVVATATPYQFIKRDAFDYDFPDNSNGAVAFAAFSGTDFTASVFNTRFTYTASAPVYLDFKVNLEGTYVNNISITAVLYQERAGDIIWSMGSAAYFGVDTPTPWFENINATGVEVQQNDVFYVDWVFYNNEAPYDQYINLDKGTFVINTQDTTLINVNPGDDLVINDAIPKNIRQIDFLVSIVKLWNLYVYEDKFDERKIYITPYVDFYSPSSAEAVDWTYKLNRDKPFRIKPMSELNSKLYNFNYKSDSDYYNDLYNKRFGMVYGSYVYDTLFEFAEQENKLELIFSPTVLVGYAGEDKIYSTIFKRTGSDSDPVEENVDSNIRILQAKKVTGVASWAIKDGATTLSSQTVYGYAGHLNDPDSPNDDLNFGSLEQLFFTLAAGNLSNTQFNVYWSSYMAEITDKDSKLLTAYFYLTVRDIFDLDFSKFIVIDGVLYRLNKITDYNLSHPSDCQVELLKVNYTIY